jgi:hypothetical protein
VIANPAAGLSRIVTELEQYWTIALAPHWPRVRSLLDADLAFRLDQLADGGVQQLLSTLHPLVSIDRDVVRVVKYYQAIPTCVAAGCCSSPALADSAGASSISTGRCLVRHDVS